jgi:hypothetical protein
MSDAQNCFNEIHAFPNAKQRWQNIIFWQGLILGVIHERHAKIFVEDHRLGSAIVDSNIKGSVSSNVVLTKRRRGVLLGLG